VSRQVGAAARALRQLVLVVAAVCLLGTGASELAPRAVTAVAATAAAPGSATSSVGRAAAARPAAESGAPSTTHTLRAALAAAAPGAGAAAAVPPGSVPLVAPHLLARPVVRPPAPSYVLGLPGGPRDRAPPGAAGT
jgi:hypothetical protein